MRTRDRASRRGTRRPTTTAAPSRTAHIRSSASAGTWPSAGAKYRHVPAADPKSRVIERVMPMLTSFRRSASSGTSARRSSRTAHVASVLPSSHTRISNDAGSARHARTWSRTTAATVVSSLSAGISTESSTEETVASVTPIRLAERKLDDEAHGLRRRRTPLVEAAVMGVDDDARELDTDAAAVVRRHRDERSYPSGDRELRVGAVAAQIDADVGGLRRARFVQQAADGLAEAGLIALDDEGAGRERDRDARPALGRARPKILDERGKVDRAMLEPEVAGLQLAERD